ncbi:unnamed protein product, partial [Amoebophrya sp. A25]|eukprot:GSA25T00005742001.1
MLKADHGTAWEQGAQHSASTPSLPPATALQSVGYLTLVPSARASVASTGSRSAN